MELSLYNLDQSELADALIGLYDPVNFSIDSLFDPQPEQFEYYDYAPISCNAPPPTPPHPPPPPPPPAITKPPSHLVTSFSEPSIVSFHNVPEYPPYPKRPKSCSDMFTFEPGHNGKSNGEPSLSSQSVAARERRRKISERTQELAKLVPGGTKLNTAEMFQAASKYVKFLQAQVGILSLMGTFQGGILEASKSMNVLLESSGIQEKLCKEGMCIVPEEMVGSLVKDGEIEKNKGVKRELDRFVGSTGRGYLKE